jgi:MFS family permease
MTYRHAEDRKGSVTPGAHSGPANAALGDVARIAAADLPLCRRAVGFAALLFAYFFYSYAWNTVDLLRPYWREAMGLTLVEVGFFYTAQSLGALLGAIVLAQVADRRGRRNTLAALTFGIGAAMVLNVYMSSYVALMAQRFVLGFFMGGVYACAVGIYVGLFEQRLRGRLSSAVAIAFGAANVFLAWVASLVLDRDWTLVLWVGGVPALVAAGVVLALVPDDRRIMGYGEGEAPASADRFPFRELFRPGFRRNTLLIVLLSGMNFFAVQAFTGWVSTYLREVRGFSGSTMGSILVWQTAAALLGSLFWGWVADRYGRRICAVGFAAGAAMIVAYLQMPPDPALLSAAGATYSFMIASSVAWGVWFAELYPAHLRSTAASLFNYGRIIGFMSPPIIAVVANDYGLSVGMLLAAAVFLLAAAIWLVLPETLNRSLAGPRH